MLITIFTPTFNRAHLLQRAFDSLKNQKYGSLEWLIVDDGSTDNTEELVKEWQLQDRDFEIRYIKKSNGGKHTAINLGVQLAKGELFAILDSDDQLTPNALQTIRETYDKFQHQNIGGIIGLTCYDDGKIIGTSFPQNEMISSFADVYYKLGVMGDKSVAFVTEKLKQFPFPEPEHIKFVSELVVWHPLSERFPIVAINKIIEKKEYIKGGLSNSSYQKWYWESLAFTNFYLIKENIHTWKKYAYVRWMEYVHLIINSKLSQSTYYKDLNWKDKIFYIIAYPRAFYSYLNIKRHTINIFTQ